MCSSRSSPTLFAFEEPDDRTRLQRLYDRLAARFGLGPARVRVSRRKLTGGEIIYGTPHRITISAHLPPAEQEETLKHEAAHAWAFRRKGARAGHGPLFRRLARQIGANRGPAPETPALADFRKRRAIECDWHECASNPSRSLLPDRRLATEHAAGRAGAQ